LRRVPRHFDGINERLGAHRDPLDDVVIGNMIAGYAMVDTLVADGIDLFALGNSTLLLELNTLVLCGTSPVQDPGDYQGGAAEAHRGLPPLGRELCPEPPDPDRVGGEGRATHALPKTHPMLRLRPRADSSATARPSRSRQRTCAPPAPAAAGVINSFPSA
jgi:hypothetical protein